MHVTDPSPCQIRFLLPLLPIPPLLPPSIDPSPPYPPSSSAPSSTLQSLDTTIQRRTTSGNASYALSVSSQRSSERSCNPSCSPLRGIRIDWTEERGMRGIVGNVTRRIQRRTLFSSVSIGSFPHSEPSASSSAGYGRSQYGSSREL